MARQLPRYQRVRPSSYTPQEALGRLEDNLYAYAEALSGPAGLLARGLTFGANAKGAVRTVPSYATGTTVDVTLGEAYPGTPTAVWLLDALAADGTHRSGLGVRWTSSTLGNLPAVRIHEVLSLPAGTYALTLLLLTE